MLLSAADDNQAGQSFNGAVHSTAKQAHIKWGFQEINQAEWKRHSPGTWYDLRGNQVTLFKKSLQCNSLIHRVQ